MHIKNSPVKGYKMDFAGFELDASKIELHSVHKREIHLPYSGPLPDALHDSDGAFISIMLRVGLSISVCLVVTKGKEKLRYPIGAAAQEINDLLFPFFFETKGTSEYHTRWDNGLVQYCLGDFQSSYTHWRRLVFEGVGVDDLIAQLSPKAFNRVAQYISERGEIA